MLVSHITQPRQMKRSSCACLQPFLPLNLKALCSTFADSPLICKPRSAALPDIIEQESKTSFCELHSNQGTIDICPIGPCEIAIGPLCCSGTAAQVLAAEVQPLASLRRGRAHGLGRLVLCHARSPCQAPCRLPFSHINTSLHTHSNINSHQGLICSRQQLLADFPQLDVCKTDHECRLKTSFGYQDCTRSTPA